MIVLFSMSLGVIFSAIMLPGLISLICRGGINKANYRGVYICSAAGGAFAIFIIIECTFIMLYAYILPEQYPLMTDIFSVLAGTLSASLFGFVDDVIGDESKGIKGHGKMLLKGRYTSGALKGLTAIFISLTIALSWRNGGAELILNMVLIFLFQNFINLMDLRPGRAVKAYAPFFLITALSGIRPAFLWVNSGVLIMLLFYLRYELAEKCMMGDAGSNALGILLGMAAASSNSMIFKYIITGFLILIHIYSEYHSISSLIENVWILKFLDSLGRRKI